MSSSLGRCRPEPARRKSPAIARNFDAVSFRGFPWLADDDGCRRTYDPIRCTSQGCSLPFRSTFPDLDKAFVCRRSGRAVTPRILDCLGGGCLSSDCRISPLCLSSTRPSAAGPHGFPLWVRYAHFFNFLFLTMLVRSGLSILMDHPRLYLNNDCTPGTEWIRFTPLKVPTDTNVDG